MRTSAAVGREAGLRERREERRSEPWCVRRGNWIRRLLMGLTWEMEGLAGRRSVRALGRRRKLGQVDSVGGPRREKICWMRGFWIISRGKRGRRAELEREREMYF